MKKIQFGSGNNILFGWENTDLQSVDIRNPLKYLSNSFDFIFHEHVIEHLDEVDGYNFMNECYRILKVNGVMRLSCPSIDGFIFVYQNWNKINENFKSRFRNKTTFINHVTFGECINYNGKMFTSNNDIFKYKNGKLWHKFLYDKDDILEKLKKIGFKKIYFVEKHHSNYVELQNLERRLNGKFKDFPKEMDFTLEAIK